MKRYPKVTDFSFHMGNALEHFDMALYGFLVPIIAPLFFSEMDPIVQLIAGYSFFATSIVTYPLGVFIFGSLAHRYGSFLGLSFSLFGLSVSTLVMAFVPSYSAMGYGAPLILLGVRFFQGFFASGESALAKLTLLEGKEKKQRYEASVLYQWFSMMGIVIAAGLSFYTLSGDSLWLWRFWYGIGGIVGLGVSLGRVMCEKRDAQKSSTLSTPPLLLDRFFGGTRKLCCLRVSRPDFLI